MTYNEFTDKIEIDWAWRIAELNWCHELFLLESQKKSSGDELDYSIKVATIMLYAHWEGFIKESATQFYQFVRAQQPLIRELNDSLIAVELKSNLKDIHDSNKLSAHRMSVKVMMEQISLDSTTLLPKDYTFPIGSNLDYIGFIEACYLIGYSEDAFQTEYKRRCQKARLNEIDAQQLIRQNLLHYRNESAHGKKISLKPQDYQATFQLIVQVILQIYKDNMLQSARNQGYKRPPTMLAR